MNSNNNNNNNSGYFQTPFLKSSNQAPYKKKKKKNVKGGSGDGLIKICTIVYGKSFFWKPPIAFLTKAIT